jgi:PhnB protein
MPAINTYLNFQGNTEEAFNFYKSIFGGDFRMVMRFKETPEAQKIPANEQNKLMHIALPVGNGGDVLMASDALLSMGHTVTSGNNFHLCVSADTKDQANQFFNGLVAGGKITMPMSDTFWGSYFGMLSDRFGIQWMVSYDRPQNQA